MLEFNRQLPAQGNALAGEAPVLDGNPLLAEGDLPEQALAGFMLPQQELLELEAPPQALEQPIQAPVPELPQEVAEQWLLGMLGQQTLQLEAREPQQIVQLQQAVQTQPEGRVLPGEPLQLPLPAPAAGADQPSPAPAAVEADWTPRQATSLVATESKPSRPLPVAAPGVPVLAVTAPLPETTLPTVLEPLAGSLAVNPASPQTAAPVAPRLVLQAPEVRLGEQMLQALRDSVEVQVRQGVQQASIRLDPPELGSMEIFVSHDSGRLNVQISAGNIEVARLLQQTSDRLRQELVGGNFLQVNVQVGSDGHSGRQQGRPTAPWQEPEVRAAQLSSESAADAQAASDVLITV